MRKSILRRQVAGPTPIEAAIRWAVVAVLAFILAVDLAGLAAQAGSLSIGARIRESGGVVRAFEVEPDGPAGLAGLRSGDTILSVCGVAAHPQLFFSDPDHIASWQGQDALYRFQEKCPGPRVELEWKGIVPREAVVESVPVGWWSSIWISSGMVLVAWAFAVASWRIWLGRDNLATRVNLAGGLCAGLGLSQLAFYQARDISIDASALRWMVALNYLGSQAVMFAGSSLALVLPHPPRRFRRARWLVWVPWLAFLVQVGFHYGRILTNPLWTTYGPGVGSMALASGIFAYRFAFEKDALARSQIKWIALSFMMGLMPLAAFTEIPLVMGQEPLIAERWSILFTGFIPLGFAFAITRYRLLDIGTFFDSFLVHLAVVLVMVGLESCFWIWIDERMIFDPARERAFLVATMLLLVFLYAPLRTWIARLFARILGRARPTAESAVEGLLDSATLLGDARAALEQTISWTLRPGSIRWIRPGKGWDQALSDLASNGARLGQELADVPESDAADLWVPVRYAGRTSALVLVPEVGLGWRLADRDLANLLARAAEPLLESQDLRRERDALQLEMNDGLGNQLYGLSLLSQDARQVPVEILRNRMERIRWSSQDAIESLRTGLAILSEPTGAFGTVLARLLLRAEGQLGGVDIRLDVKVQDEVAALVLEGRHCFTLLRGIQEALGNAARDSGVSNIVVDISLRKGMLRTMVEGDGKGLERSDESPGQAFTHIERSLSESGGSGSIESIPGKGTRVVLELPFLAREDN